MLSGIEIKIDPVIVSFGALELRWYSLAILVGIIAAIIISVYEARRKGISPETILSLAPVALIGGIVGARLFHLFDHWSYYSANPAKIIQIQEGGLAIWGALLGGALAVIIYSWRSRISIGKIMDLLVPGFLVAQIIGRFGCIINGCSYGGPTGLPWGFIYVHPHAMVPIDLIGIPTQPYPVYDMLWNLMTLALVIKYRDRITQNGLLFVSYLLFYAVGRFFLTFVRQENILFWGLQEAQVVAGGIFILAGAVALYLKFKNRPMSVSESAGQP